MLVCGNTGEAGRGPIFTAHTSQALAPTLLIRYDDESFPSARPIRPQLLSVSDQLTLLSSSNMIYHLQTLRLGSCSSLCQECTIPSDHSLLLILPGPAQQCSLLQDALPAPCSPCWQGHRTSLSSRHTLPSSPEAPNTFCLRELPGSHRERTVLM